MKNNLLLLLLAFMLVNTAFSQRIKKTKADSLRDAGDLVLAIEEYSKQYKTDTTNARNTYNYACALSLNQQADSAFFYLNKAVAKDTTVRPLTDPDFYYISKDDRWKKLEKSLVAKVEKKYGKYQNLPLSSELWSMLQKDQAFYYQLKVAEKKAGRNSPVVSAIWELKRILNTKNVKRIQEIIDKYGWPKKSIVKGAAASAVFLVIQHANLEIQKKYLPLMREAANNGEASWRSLALLIDRVNLGLGEKQIYGSQIDRDPKTGEYYVLPLEDPENVDKRRKEVGLGKLNDYTKHWNFSWDIEKYKQRNKEK